MSVPTLNAAKVRAPRLRELAVIIDGSGRFTTKIERGYCNTDRKIAGTRLRHPGKGREGTRLLVFNLKGEKVLDHNSAETYRTNGDVVAWMERNGLKVRKEWPRY